VNNVLEFEVSGFTVVFMSKLLIADVQLAVVPPVRAVLATAGKAVVLLLASGILRKSQVSGQQDTSTEHPHLTTTSTQIEQKNTLLLTVSSSVLLEKSLI
jgi:hypothetical protein